MGIRFIEQDALFSACRRFRYRLWRRWAPGGKSCCFIMLNPSTADEAVLDPTVRRCVGYAMSWGYSALWVGNLFALRSTNPRALYDVNERIGDDWNNDGHLVQMAHESDLTVCGWGNHGGYLDRGRKVLGILQRELPIVRQPHYLKLTGAGEPGHPLYLPKSLKPIPFIKARQHHPTDWQPDPPGMRRNRAPCGECRRFVTIQPTGDNVCALTEERIGRFHHALAPIGEPCFVDYVTGSPSNHAHGTNPARS